MRRANWYSFSSIAVLLALLAAARADTLRDRAWQALTDKVHDQAHRKHALAVEAIMREFAGAVKVGAVTADRDEWGLAGLLHDIDLDQTELNLSRHGIVAEKSLREIGVSEFVIHAIAAHDDHTNVARTSKLDHALYVADQMYWRIRNGHVREAAPEELVKESAALGLTMAQVVDLSEAGMRKASPNQLL